MTWDEFTDRLAAVLREFEDGVYLTVQVSADPSVWFQARIPANGGDLLLHAAPDLDKSVTDELAAAGWKPDDQDCMDIELVWPAPSSVYQAAAEQLVRVLRSSPAATGPEALDQMGWREGAWETGEDGDLVVLSEDEDDHEIPELGIRYR